MILLIDAYNVLKQLKPSVQISERERKSFIEQLGQYAKKKQHKIVLVFDGGPYDRATQERIAGLYIVYSGALETADAYIKRYLKEHKSLDILLISSDNELRSTAARFNIESMRAPDFYKIMLVEIRFQGTMQTLSKFIYELQNSALLLKASRLQINSKGADQRLLEGVIQISRISLP